MYMCTHYGYTIAYAYMYSPWIHNWISLYVLKTDTQSHMHKCYIVLALFEQSSNIPKSLYTKNVIPSWALPESNLKET